MSDRTRLIVNADDLGESSGVNRGIALAHEGGVVTSASLLVDGRAAEEAAAWASRRELSVGLHVDLGEWAFRMGSWEPVREVVDVRDGPAVEREARRQREAFRSLTGRDPTHLDSHQHVHRRDPVRAAMSALAAELSVPLRHFSPAVRYCGEFYGQSVDGRPLDGVLTTATLSRIIADLPPGVTELCCHPGLGGDLAGMYGSEREREVRVLCDPRAAAAIEAHGVELVSFSEVRA
jgi:chitin disaccharide deacetylase